ncbi:tetratricopeptide repeat protein [Amycolatopsis sp. SID8362]|uniref:tetratricopeptide repeat protein n=1 Tax=Amycolatopsis sp. SID8362 TaxID=2690346 RepID=UPI00136DD3BE|nr:tetratricopeptide repeat protein [Amycolatopsis sp. SID8362]NBH06795.1 tetratricopeptide repeat protein [Amycolatopsis sp. SID8362]NED43492.1 tetratricopeptide repeat protein [Amycolatopsis sp. SID8362]
MRHRDIEDRLWPGERVPYHRVRDTTRSLDDRLSEVNAKNDNRQCMISLGGWDVDYLRFTRGITEAKGLEGHRRMAKLKEALTEWRAEPLVDADLEKFDLSRERAFLDSLRRTATIDLLDAMAGCGELTAFRTTMLDAVRRWPHDVPLLTLVSDVLADTESGTRAGAFLAAHIREHGDPDDRLAELQARFGPPATAAPPRAPVPRQLPGHHRHLVGRRAELQALTDILVEPGPANAGIALVSGMAGVGKTGLVCSWAAKFEDRFPGGTLYADLNGFGSLRPESTEQILARMLADLGAEPATTTPDGLITAFRSATAGRSVLVVLDNARDSAQARPLLPGTGCPVVVTSRNRLESLITREGAQQLTVRPLERTEAVTMLADSLGEARMRQAGHLVGEIAELVGGLPLALAVVAARVATRPADAVRTIRDALRKTKTRLDTLSFKNDTDLNVRVALSYSHGGLSGPAAELWALLALHPGPTISLAAAVDLAARDCAGEIEELVGAHLLDERAHERYAMHDLVRDYGTELAGSLPPGRAEEVGSAVFEFLLQHVWACDQALVPGRELPIRTSGTVAAPRTVRDAMTWLDAEYPTITAALRQAAEARADRYTWLVAMALTTYLWRRSKFADADRYLRAAADAAERVAGLPDRAMVYRMLAGSRWNMKEYGLAKGAQRCAIRLSEQAGDVRGIAYGHVGLAALHLDQDEHAQARAEYSEARTLFRRLGDELGEADALSGLAQVAMAEGDHDRAVRACSDASDRYAQAGDVNGQAAVLVVLGEVHEDRGDLSRAAATYDLAIARYRSLTRHSHEARTLVRLAGVLRQDGRAADSTQALLDARTLYRDLGDEAGLDRVEELLTDA